MKLNCLCLIILLFISGSLYAQQFGANPAGIRWKQINTDTVRIIFPEVLADKAQRTASIIHSIQKNYSSTIINSPKKIDIVLHNETTITNAYVGLAPWRSEFYLMPPQDPFELGSISWMDNLSIHEYRHVEQYHHFNRGLSKIAGIIAGEQGRAVANAGAVPDWFFEGDAVFNETKLSTQGRGKVPLFMNSYKALLQQGKLYNYMQLRNGSYRHYIPDHYNLGYLLVAYGYQQYGNDFWKKVTQDAAAYKPLIYPMQGAIKKYSHKNFSAFVSDAFKWYNDQWQQQALNNVQWLTPVQQHDVVDYKYPYTTNDGSLIVLKRSYRTAPAFYKIDNGIEQKIKTRSIAYDDYFSFNGHTIAYAAYKADARWGYKEYSNITLLNMDTKEEQTITQQSRYFSPDISHSQDRVVAVEMMTSGQCALVVMDTTGNNRQRWTSGTIIYSHPKFSSDDKSVFVAARKLNGEMGIFKISKSPVPKMEKILPYGNRLIGFLQVQGDTLLFTITINDKDELWAYVERSKQLYAIASINTGLYKGTWKKDSVIAAAFTSDGYRLATFKPLWQPQELEDNSMADLYVDNAFNDVDHAFLENVEQRDFAVTDYHKTMGLFRFHSWRPWYDHPEYSLTLYSDNTLNTFHNELAYTYNYNESSHKLAYTAVYGGWYVQPFVSLGYTWNRSAALNADTTVHWNEWKPSLGVQLPLNFSQGKQYRYLTLQSYYTINQTNWTGIGSKLFKDAQLGYLTGVIRYTGQQQKAVQQIYPHWAQTFLAQYKTATDQHMAHQLLLSGSLYLPGLSNNHSLVLSAAYQSRDTANQYYYDNDFPFSRGYRSVDFPRMMRASANYHLPLAYPDWGLGNIVYFLRVRANLFYDYTQTKSLRTGTHYTFNTLGAELYFDTKWWNQQPVSFGIRYSRLLNNEYRGSTQPNQWEFIIPVLF